MESIEGQDEAYDSLEHTRWAADRANDVLKRGDLKGAIASMVADLEKDPNRPEQQRGMIVRMGMALSNDPDLTVEKVQQFIEGFPGATKRPSLSRPPAPEVTPYFAPEQPAEELQNAEDFINTIVNTDNNNLTDAAKIFLTQKARSTKGPWSVKDFVESVSQEGDKITIKNRQRGEAFFYLS